MWNTLKYIGIVVCSLCSGYFLVCGVVLFFLYQDRSGGVWYAIKALLPIFLYFIIFFSDEIHAWTQKRKAVMHEDITPTSNT